MSENLEPLVSLNPSGNVYSHYDPQSRANAPLGENMTTLAETSKLSDDTIVTVYRGVPAGVQREKFQATTLLLIRNWHETMRGTVTSYPFKFRWGICSMIVMNR